MLLVTPSTFLHYWANYIYTKDANKLAFTKSPPMESHLLNPYTKMSLSLGVYTIRKTFLVHKFAEITFFILIVRLSGTYNIYVVTTVVYRYGHSSFIMNFFFFNIFSKIYEPNIQPQLYQIRPKKITMSSLRSPITNLSRYM